MVSSRQPKGDGRHSVSALAGRIHGNLAMVNPKQINLSVIEFLYWMAASAASFTVVYLQERGMSSSQVGVVMAMLNVFGILAPPFWGMISDKLRSIKKVLLLCLVLGSLVFALIPFTSNYYMGPWMVAVVALLISSFFRTPTMSLLDSWMIRNVNTESNMSYGSIRLWGSIGYAIMAFLFGIIIKKMGSAANTFYLYGILNLPLIFLFLFRKGDEDAGSKKPLSFRELQVGRLTKNFFLVTFLLFNTILYLPVQSTFTFLPYLITEIAGDSSSLGTIISIKALMEVPMLIASTYLVRRFGVVKMIILGGMLYTLEQFSYMICHSIPQVTMVMVLHGTAYGIYLACSVSYIYMLAPKELSATAQTVCGALSALAGILGNLVGGYLIDAMGIRSYYGISGIIVLVALALFLLTFPIGKRFFHQTLPSVALRTSPDK